MNINNKVKEVIEKIDITYLKADIITSIVHKYINLCKRYGFYGLCLPMEKIIENYKEIEKIQSKIVTVIGFPFGYNNTDYKIKEIAYIKNFCIDEYDIVMNVSKFLEKDYKYVEEELTKIRKFTKNKTIKVIIEACYLNKRQILDAVSLLINCGIDFVKTSTGFGASGARLEDIELIKNAFGDKIMIKASGGIKTFEQAVMFINAGADRLGMSNVDDIIEKYESS
ncbi:deoxyribose-phosphate aldolase [Deferribacter thermophilus]|uniref:deoxyribose-phosphate aldolase n=1 Tax=Deferribacter thermophilus TaxID=53573 RepID=UPI003C1C246E